MEVLSPLEVPVSLFSQGESWAEIFGREAPLKVEICSGKDEFVIRMAEREPETNFVGIERSLPISGKLLSKVNRSGLPNIRVIRDDAHLAFTECFQKESITKIFINFPDPWPKRRHHHRRLVNSQFTQQMIDCLVPKGELQFVSDHKEYVAWALQYFEQNPNIKNLFGKGNHQNQLEGYPPTIFMKKYLREGRPFHFLLFQKI